MALGTGIIGMGFIGESHIEAVRRIKGVKLVAVADVNAALANEKAETYGIDNAYSSLDDLLADPKVDVIHNCTPNFLHTEINLRILASGKHLLSEKPLSTTYSEALSLVRESKKHPELVAAVNFNYRMNPMVLEMRERISRGDAGAIRVVSGSYEQDWLLYDTDYSWRLDPEKAGNSCAVADIGSHWFDIVQFVTGQKIVSLSADFVTVIPKRKKPLSQALTFSSCGNTEYEEVEIKNEDYAAIMFKMSGGATGVFHVSQVSAGRGNCFGFEVCGEKLSYGWNQEENDRLWVGRRDGDNGYVIRNPGALCPSVRKYTSLAVGHPEGWNDAFKGNLAAFYRYIINRDSIGDNQERCFASLEEAAYIMKLTEKARQSSRERRWIDV